MLGNRQHSAGANVCHAAGDSAAACRGFSVFSNTITCCHGSPACVDVLERESRHLLDDLLLAHLVNQFDRHRFVFQSIPDETSRPPGFSTIAAVISYGWENSSRRRPSGWCPPCLRAVSGSVTVLATVSMLVTFRCFIRWRMRASISGWMSTASTLPVGPTCGVRETQISVGRALIIRDDLAGLEFERFDELSGLFFLPRCGRSSQSAAWWPITARSRGPYRTYRSRPGRARGGTRTAGFPLRLGRIGPGGDGDERQHKSREVRETCRNLEWADAILPYRIRADARARRDCPSTGHARISRRAEPEAPSIHVQGPD